MRHEANAQPTGCLDSLDEQGVPSSFTEDELEMITRMMVEGRSVREIGEAIIKGREFCPSVQC